MGRLTAAAGAEGAAAPIVPNAAVYAAPYAVGYQHHGPGFGGFFFLLLGAGALFFFISRMVMMARRRSWAAMQGGPQGWPQGGPQGGPQADCITARRGCEVAGAAVRRAPSGIRLSTGSSRDSRGNSPHSSPRLARRLSSRLSNGRTLCPRDL